MKIFYCIDSLEKSGGTERVTTTKVNWLAEQADIEVYVVTINDKTPYFQLSDKVNRIVLNVEPLSSKKYTAEISKYIDRIKPDVCIAVSGIATNVLYNLKDHSKKIIEFHYTKNFLVNFVQGIRKIRFKNLHVLKMRWLQWRLQKQAKKYDCMVGLTKRDVGLWGNPKNMTYIYNPLSFRSSIKSTCDNKKIIAVGSWTPAKGMDQLIEAFALIAPKHTDWTVEIYGSGQDEALLKELIAQNNLEDQVFLFEPCKNIGQKLVEASIYAFPSRSDGFGLVITEAMECGLPTVAMDCECGPREIVTSETGIVVADKDTREFANALEKLIDDEDLRKSMGKRASAEVKRFYPDNIMPNWVNLFTPPPDNNSISSTLPLWYIEYVKQRSRLSFIKGLLGRIYLNSKNEFRKWYAQRHGATIGEGTWISWKVAKMANSNLIIGDDCAIDAKSLDLRGKIIIGNHVIINSDVEIIRVSHHIDNDHKFNYRYFPDLKIEEYCWIATGSKILPSVSEIKKGSVIGAYSVMVKDSEEMGVYGGNPAILLRHHNSLYDDFLVGTLHGTDLKHYISAKKL